MSKMTVVFDVHLQRVLTALSIRHGLPKTQVLRRAIALLNFTHKESERGHRVVILDNTDKVLKELVL